MNLDSFWMGDVCVCVVGCCCCWFQGLWLLGACMKASVRLTSWPAHESWDTVAFFEAAASDWTCCCLDWQHHRLETASPALKCRVSVLAVVEGLLQ